VIRIFPNQQACLRLVSALAAEQHDLWISGKRYLNMEPLHQWLIYTPAQLQDTPIPLNVPIGEWEKIPRLKAKTLVCPEGASILFLEVAAKTGFIRSSV